MGRHRPRKTNTKELKQTMAELEALPSKRVSKYLRIAWWKMPSEAYQISLDNKRKISKLSRGTIVKFYIAHMLPGEHMQFAQYTQEGRYLKRPCRTKSEAISYRERVLARLELWPVDAFVQEEEEAQNVDISPGA